MKTFLAILAAILTFGIAYGGVALLLSFLVDVPYVTIARFPIYIIIMGMVAVGCAFGVADEIHDNLN